MDIERREKLSVNIQLCFHEVFLIVYSAYIFPLKDSLDEVEIQRAVNSHCD